MTASVIRSQSAGVLGLFLCTGGTTVQGQPAPMQATNPPSEGNPADWQRFKALWRSLDAGDRTLADPEGTLAASFGYPPEAWDETLRWTELEAAGVAPERKILTPARYALAVLTMARIHTLRYEARPALLVTRMAYFPPWQRAEQRFRTMEDPTLRLAGLTERWKPGGPEAATLLLALQSLRMDVYHLRALRLAVEAHRRRHLDPGAPAITTSGPSGLEALAAQVERTSLQAFLQDPAPFQAGSDPWLDRYERAMQKVRGELAAPHADQLQAQEASFVAALKALEAARPRLERLIEALETPSPAAP